MLILIPLMLIAQSLDLSIVGLGGQYGDLSAAWFKHIGTQFEYVLFGQTLILLLELLCLIRGYLKSVITPSSFTAFAYIVFY